MKTPSLVIAALFVAAGAIAQQPQQSPQIPPNDGKVRVYITDSQSWQITGGWAYGRSGSNASGSGWQQGGARPQTAEIIKTFNQRCPQVTITNNREVASYAVILDHEGGKGPILHKNKIALFNRVGDVIFSTSTRSVGGAVKDACAAIERDAPDGRKPTQGCGITANCKGAEPKRQ